MCVNDLPKVELDSTAAGTEPAISSRKSNALTNYTPPSHRFECIASKQNFISWWTMTVYVYNTVYSELTVFKTSWARRAG